MSEILECPACRARGYMKSDKKGRPYWACHVCGMRAFLSTGAAANGFRMASLVLSETFDTGAWRAELERAILSAGGDQVALPVSAVPVNVPAMVSVPKVREGATV